MSEQPQLPKGVDQSFRKTFNPEDYKDRAAILEKERAKKAGEAPVVPKDIFAQPQREPLKARDFEVTKNPFLSFLSLFSFSFVYLFCRCLSSCVDVPVCR